MQYRRTKTPGASYFFTVVTHNRHRILCEPENVEMIKDGKRQYWVWFLNPIYKSFCQFLLAHGS